MLAFHWGRTRASRESSVRGTQGLTDELHRWNYQFPPDFCSLLMKASGRERLLHRSTFKCKTRRFPFRQDQECLFNVSPNSTARPFTTKPPPPPSVFFFSPKTRGRLRFQPYLPRRSHERLVRFYFWLRTTSAWHRFLPPPHQDSRSLNWAV